MSKNRQPVSITLLDKEYVVGCSEDEKDDLLASANYLNKKMLEQRDTGKVAGSEKIAVMTALNIASEYLNLSTENRSEREDYQVNISRISDKITKALTFRRA